MFIMQLLHGVLRQSALFGVFFASACLGVIVEQVGDLLGNGYDFVIVGGG